MGDGNPLKKTVWFNCKLATMNPEIDDCYGLLDNMVLITQGEDIAAILASEEVNWSDYDEAIDIKGALITPGLIDFHTHLVFGGGRAAEWEMRLNGVSYTEIANLGGGIKSTVAATREATFDELYAKSAQRLKFYLAEGVTTIEMKSGYGLELKTERKQLQVAQALANNFAVDVSTTLLSAHSVPAEFSGRPDEYLDYIINTIMPSLWDEGLFEVVDIFCENIAFDLKQTNRLFKAATDLGIPVKGHMEQLSNIGGSRLAASYQALSVDHIEKLDVKAIQAMSQSGTVAGLLPMAFYFLKDTNIPPVDLLRKYQVPMAVSTDFNPGTSPFTSLRMAMNMACTLFGLTPVEALAGTTRNAARALGREEYCGQLKPGLKANLAIWQVAEPVEILYEIGVNPLIHRVYKGQIC